MNTCVNVILTDFLAGICIKTANYAEALFFVPLLISEQNDFPYKNQGGTPARSVHFYLRKTSPSFTLYENVTFNAQKRGKNKKKERAVSLFFQQTKKNQPSVKSQMFYRTKMIIIVPRFCQTSLHASTVSCVTKDFGKLVPQLEKHTQWETLSVLCAHVVAFPWDGLLQCTLQKLSIQNHLSVLWPDLWNYSTDSPVKMPFSLWGGSSLHIWFQTSDLLPSGPVTKSDHKPFSQQPCQYKKSKYAQLSIIALLKVNENSLISVLTVFTCYFISKRLLGCFGP